MNTEPWLEPLARAICDSIAKDAGHGPEYRERFVEMFWRDCEGNARDAYAELQRQGLIIPPGAMAICKKAGGMDICWKSGLKGCDYAAPDGRTRCPLKGAV